MAVAVLTDARRYLSVGFLKGSVVLSRFSGVPLRRRVLALDPREDGPA